MARQVTAAPRGPGKTGQVTLAKRSAGVFKILLMVVPYGESQA